MAVYNGIRTFYEKLISCGNCLQSFLLLVLRLYWGYAFFQAGWGKIQNISSPIRFFTSLGIPFPEFSAYLVGWTECIGGILLIAGFASRLAAVPLSITMITALLTAHIDAVRLMFVNQGKFISQSPVTYLIVTLVVLAFGPGVVSLDAFFKRYVFKQGR